MNWKQTEICPKHWVSDCGKVLRGSTKSILNDGIERIDKINGVCRTFVNTIRQGGWT